MSTSASPAALALQRARSGWWLAALSAVLFSAKAILVKLAFRHGVDATTFLAQRMLLSMPVFALVLAWLLWRDPAQPPISARDGGLIILAGLLGYYAASLLDFMGLAYISAGLERLILFTYPSLVLLGTCLLCRQWPAGRALGALALSYLGLLLVFGREVVLEGPHVVLGASLVLASSFCYALYLMLSGRLLKRLGTLRVTALATLVSGGAILLQVVLSQPWSLLRDQPLAVWQLSVCNALFCTVLPVFAGMAAIARIGASRVAQIGMLGPLVTIGLGAVLLGEPFTQWHVAGTLLVLGGAYLLGRVPGKVQAES